MLWYTFLTNKRFITSTIGPKWSKIISLDNAISNEVILNSNKINIY